MADPGTATASLAGFFAMGGYGRFVWTAFGLTAAVLIGLWLISRRTLRARQAELARLTAEAGSEPGEGRRSEGGR